MPAEGEVVNNVVVDSGSPPEPAEPVQETEAVETEQPDEGGGEETEHEESAPTPDEGDITPLLVNEFFPDPFAGMPAPPSVVAPMSYPQVSPPQPMLPMPNQLDPRLIQVDPKEWDQDPRTATELAIKRANEANMRLIQEREMIQNAQRTYGFVQQNMAEGRKIVERVVQSDPVVRSNRAVGYYFKDFLGQAQRQAIQDPKTAPALANPEFIKHLVGLAKQRAGVKGTATAAPSSSTPATATLKTRTSASTSSSPKDKLTNDEMRAARDMGISPKTFLENKRLAAKPTYKE